GLLTLGATPGSALPMSWLPSVAKGPRTPEIGAEVAVDQLGRWHLHTTPPCRPSASGEFKSRRSPITRASRECLRVPVPPPRPKRLHRPAHVVHRRVNRRNQATTSHLAGGKAGSVAKPGRLREAGVRNEHIRHRSRQEFFGNRQVVHRDLERT